MENFRRYFNMFPTLYILEDGLSPKMFELFSNICPKLSKLSLSEAVAGKDNFSHPFVVMEFSEATSTKILSIIGKAPSAEIIIVCDNKDDLELLDIAISHKVCAVLGRTPSPKELGEKLKLAITSLITKQKEKSRYNNYFKLSERSNVLSCVRNGDKITFANSQMLAHFGAADIATLNSLERENGGLLDAIYCTEDENGIYAKDEKNDTYLVNVNNIKNEQVVSCFKVPIVAEKHNDLLSHSDFIELLKNTLIHRDAVEGATFAVVIKLENAQKILKDFGSELFYNYFKKFGSFCGFFFEKDPFIFWYFDYLVILPEESELESVTATAEQLFAQSGQFKNEQEITPFIDLSVLALSHLSINGAISLIESVYTKSQTQSQSAKICLTKSSTTVCVADGQMAMYHIQNICDKDYKIKLLNIYKGLSISSSSKIIKIVDGDIHVQTEKLQKYLMHTERSVVIQSEHTPKEIFAEVKYVDLTEPYAILRNPLFLEFSANNRKSVRVQCDMRIPITLKSDHFTFTGEIFDISMQAVAVQYKNKINGDIVGSKAKMTFSLPSKEADNGVSKVVVEGKITVTKTLDEYMMIIASISTDKQNEALILEYIYLRQKELIAEIKKLGGMIFK
jgi:hypothetical protein